MSARRGRIAWGSGRQVETQESGFWTPSRTEVDPEIPYLPLEDPAGGGGFPTQFAGFRTFYSGAVKELCLVAACDGATGMGGMPMMDKNGTVYAVYLVETTDPNASHVYLRTGTATKAIRLKT